MRLPPPDFLLLLLRLDFLLEEFLFLTFLESLPLPDTGVLETVEIISFSYTNVRPLHTHFLREVLSLWVKLLKLVISILPEVLRMRQRQIVQALRGVVVLSALKLQSDQI